MATKYHQISLNEIFSDCQTKLMEEVPSFFQILSEHFDLDVFIPTEFVSAFYLSVGRTRLYPLHSFLSAFILQKIFSIPTDSLLLLFIRICKELRDFCGFSKVPDAPLMTRFKQHFQPYIELMFQRMVDCTEPICQAFIKTILKLTLIKWLTVLCLLKPLLVPMQNKCTSTDTFVLLINLQS